MTNSEQIKSLMATKFAMDMMTDPYGDYFDPENINGERDFSLEGESIKNVIYKRVSEMIYEGYSSYEIFEYLENIEKMICVTNINIDLQEKIIRGAKRLVLERKDMNNNE